MSVGASKATQPIENLIPVLLLKTRSLPVDSYEEYFNSLPKPVYRPIFVPVLEHKFNRQALGSLKSLILGGSFCRADSQKVQNKSYGGLIFTSQRAVEAFADIVRQIRSEGDLIDKFIPHNLPLFVVGPATARGIKALNLNCPVLGEDTGNGEVLADYILKHYNASRSNVAADRGNLPLLFLIGEKRRDIIPKTLQASTLPETQRIPVDEMVIYETGLMESFPGDLAALANASLPKNVVQWYVVFSPTGCDVLLDTLGMLDPSTGKIKDNEASSLERKTFIATIGPTTRDYMNRQFDFHPDVCAASPSPQGVGEAIEEFMGRKTPMGDLV